MARPCCIIDQLVPNKHTGAASKPDRVFLLPPHTGDDIRYNSPFSWLQIISQLFAANNTCYDGPSSASDDYRSNSWSAET